jgi:Tfp pilus assembly protein PilF
MNAPLRCMFVVCLLSGCAAPPVHRLPPVTTLFDDSRFIKPPAPPDAAQLFAMSPAMRAHLDSGPFRAQLRKRGKERGLVAALYDAGELKLEYDGALTRAAAEAYDARRGNCLSLVIMTAAFAKALGVEVRYQNVVVDESWRRSGELMVFSSHVNLTLGKPGWAENNPDAKNVGAGRALTIDFLPGEDVAGYHRHEIPESTIVAMYFNNRAVEALLRQHLDEAYWWARAALRQDAAFIAAYNTLAVIYRRHGDLALAERSWRLALAREPEHVVVMRNLAPLLAATGRAAEADALIARAATIEPHPPFHFYALGMAAMERQDYAAAKTLFGREVARAPFHDEFHFWLGMALLRLGDAGRAREQMALAVQTSTSEQTGRLYAAKLEQMKKGAAARVQ